LSLGTTTSLGGVRIHTLGDWAPRLYTRATLESNSKATESKARVRLTKVEEKEMLSGWREGARPTPPLHEWVPRSRRIFKAAYADK
jgi:hypothetical protein